MTKSDFIEHTDPALDELQSKAESMLTTIRNIKNRQELNPVIDISKYFATSLHSKLTLIKDYRFMLAIVKIFQGWSIA